MSYNTTGLAANVLHTLRWYLAEQQCLAEDNWALFEAFSGIFPPTMVCTNDVRVPLTTVYEYRTPITIEQLLQFLSKTLYSKLSLVKAYKEYFYKITPSATGRIRNEGDTNVYGAMSRSLQKFLKQQEPLVQAVRELTDALAMIVPPEAATAAPTVRQLPRAAPAAATLSYVEQFLERLADNLDAELSLDSAHVTYCALVYRPHVNLVPSHQPSQQPQEQQQQPAVPVRVQHRNQLPPPGTRTAVVVEHTGQIGTIRGLWQQ